jgi:hypothetical protein
MEQERGNLVSPAAEVPVVEGDMVTAIRELSDGGWGSKAIARELGIARNTVRRYRRAPARDHFFGAALAWRDCHSDWYRRSPGVLSLAQEQSHRFSPSVIRRNEMPNVAQREIVGKCALSARGERGVILLVVVGMLQLLALIGLAFTVYASHGGPADAIARVEQDIQRAQADLTALLENPDDASLQESALVSVDQTLRESSAITDGSETPTPETRRLDGLLHAAYALFEQIVALLREPRSIASQ